jgi:hypothetical protein
MAFGILGVAKQNSDAIASNGDQVRIIALFESASRPHNPIRSALNFNRAHFDVSVWQR